MLLAKTCLVPSKALRNVLRACATCAGLGAAAVVDVCSGAAGVAAAMTCLAQPDGLQVTAVLDGFVDQYVPQLAAAMQVRTLCHNCRSCHHYFGVSIVQSMSPLSDLPCTRGYAALRGVCARSMFKALAGPGIRCLWWHFVRQHALKQPYALARSNASHHTSRRTDRPHLVAPECAWFRALKEKTRACRMSLKPRQSRF